MTPPSVGRAVAAGIDGERQWARLPVVIERDKGMEKTQRVVYHVLPVQGGGWSVKQVNSGKELGNHRSRTNAILQARDLALSQKYSLLVVHDREGKVEKEYNYGRRPG